MSWEKEVADIAARRERALAMGGAGKVERQHAAGRRTIRERIERLVDPGSFLEIGVHAGFYTADRDDAFMLDGYVCGLAKVDGRDIVVGGEDFTVKGGTEGSEKV